MQTELRQSNCAVPGAIPQSAHNTTEAVANKTEEHAAESPVSSAAESAGADQHPQPEQPVAAAGDPRERNGDRRSATEEPSAELEQSPAAAPAEVEARSDSGAEAEGAAATIDRDEQHGPEPDRSLPAPEVMADTDDESEGNTPGESLVDSAVVVSEQQIENDSPERDEGEAADLAKYGMPVHPVCNMFPLMPSDRLDQLAADILKNGQLQPILVHEGQIVDGRNRLLACRMVGVKPWIVEWRDHYKGTMSLSRWIWSTNATRRHLTDDQMAATHVLMCGWEEREAARQRQAEGRKRGGELAGRGRPQGDSSMTNSSSSYSAAGTHDPATSDAVSAAEPEKQPKKARQAARTKMAKDAGVSEYKMQQALNVAEASPELAKKVAADEVPLREAHKQVKGKTAQVKQPRPKATSQKDEDVACTKRGRGAKKLGFDMEAAITAAMRWADEVLDTIPEDQRDAFIDGLIETLEKLR